MTKKQGGRESRGRGTTWRQLCAHAFYLTDHHRAYPWVLMRLARGRLAAARELLEEAWRRAAPRRVVEAHVEAAARAARSRPRRRVTPAG